MTNQKNINLTRPFFENLDALRFLAAFSVFVFHYVRELKSFLPISPDNKLYNYIQIFTDKGSLGVNFFFVLSGFLISYLIFHEHENKGFFNLKNFLIRRTLRIWPLYFLIVIIGFALFPLIIEGYSTEHKWYNYVFFLANFDEIKYGLNDSINFLTSPWSIAVEEQFYLFWGILFFVHFKVFKFSPRYYIFALFIFAFVFRIMFKENDRILYYHTFSVMPDILMGSLFAYLYYKKHKLLNSIINLKKGWIILIYLLGFLMIIAKNKIFIGDWIIMERFMIAGYFTFILMEQIILKNSPFQWGKIKLFSKFGKISYGIYLYHLLIIFLLTKLMNYLILNFQNEVGNLNYWLVLLFFLLSFIGTIVIAAISYQFFEKPILNLKKRFY